MHINATYIFILFFYIPTCCSFILVLIISFKLRVTSVHKNRKMSHIYVNNLRQ